MEMFVLVKQVPELMLKEIIRKEALMISTSVESTFMVGEDALFWTDDFGFLWIHLKEA